MIALGVVAAVWLFGRRLEERGAGTRDDASSIAIWAVLAGVIGARLYHVATDWDRFADDLGQIPQDLEGRSRHPRRAPARHSGRAVLRRRREGHLDADGRHVRGAGDPARTGDRPMGQLLQPGAVRPADRPAVGAARSTTPTARVLRESAPRSIRRSCTNRCGASALCVPVALDRPQVPAGARPADGDVRDRLRHRSVLGRGPAHRPRPTSWPGCGGTSGSRSSRSSAGEWCWPGCAATPCWSAAIQPVE